MKSHKRFPVKLAVQLEINSVNHTGMTVISHKQSDINTTIMAMRCLTYPGSTCCKDVQMFSAGVQWNLSALNMCVPPVIG